MFCKQFLAYAVHIDWCYHSIHKHSRRSQHVPIWWHRRYIIHRLQGSTSSFHYRSPLYSKIEFSILSRGLLLILVLSKSRTLKGCIGTIQYLQFMLAIYIHTFTYRIFLFQGWATQLWGWLSAGVLKISTFSLGECSWLLSSCSCCCGMFRGESTRCSLGSTRYSLGSTRYSLGLTVGDVKSWDYFLSWCCWQWKGNRVWKIVGLGWRLVKNELLWGSSLLCELYNMYMYFIIPMYFFT